VPVGKKEALKYRHTEENEWLKKIAPPSINSNTQVATRQLHNTIPPQHFAGFVQQ
jgi:hypothetical protein